MADGLVSIQDRKPELTGETAERRPARRAFRHKTDTVSQPVRSEQDEKVRWERGAYGQRSRDGAVEERQLLAMTVGPAAVILATRHYLVACSLEM